MKSKIIIIEKKDNEDILHYCCEDNMIIIVWLLERWLWLFWASIDIKSNLIHEISNWVTDTKFWWYSIKILSKKYYTFK